MAMPDSGYGIYDPAIDWWRVYDFTFRLSGQGGAITLSPDLARAEYFCLNVVVVTGAFQATVSIGFCFPEELLRWAKDLQRLPTSEEGAILFPTGELVQHACPTFQSKIWQDNQSSTGWYMSCQCGAPSIEGAVAAADRCLRNEDQAAALHVRFPFEPQSVEPARSEIASFIRWYDSEVRLG